MDTGSLISKPKKSKISTIGSNKSAQTQFKTALRNHIDLSAIADNKANIMLSVNALIVTVAIPLLVDRLNDREDLLIPTIILAAVSLASIVLATLSTRPAKMTGRSTPEQIKNKRSNLFFFGNFFRMSLEEYEAGVRQIVSDSELLDSSITSDLYFLGRALGKKFTYLRWCYTLFMYGIISAVLSFVIITLV